MKLWCVTRFANQTDRMVCVAISEEKAMEYIQKLALNNWANHVARERSAGKETSQLFINPQTILDNFWRDASLDIEEMELLE